MSPRMQRFAAACFAVALAGAAGASTANWGTATPVEVRLGPVAPPLAGEMQAGVGAPENPVVLFGFNPQPEPPPQGVILSTEVTPSSVDKMLTGVDAQQLFQMLVGVRMEGMTVDLFMPPVAGPFGGFSVFADIGVDTLELRFGLSTGFGGLGSDPVSFNPQPEPPPRFGAGFDTAGLDFGLAVPLAFGGWRAQLEADEVMLRLQVFDGNGAPLALAPAAQVPAPAAGLALAAALAGLAALRRRRAAALD